MTNHEHRDYFRSFLESLDDWVWEIDLNGVHTYSNDAVEPLLGFTPDEVIGKSSLDFWPAYLKTPDFIAQFGDSMKTGDGWKNVNAVFQHRDGSIVRVKSSANPIHDGEGRVIGYRGIDHNVTEEVRIRNELEVARKDWETIFQSIGHPTVILDPDHTIIQANRAVEIASGEPFENVIGKKCYEVFHRTDATATGCPMDSLMEAGDGKPVEMEMEAFGETYIVNCTPIYHGDGTLEKVIHMATNITERRIAEEVIKGSEKKLIEAQRVAKLGYYVFDITTGFWTNSPELDAIFGTDESYEKDLEGWIRIVHPDWKGTMSDYLQNKVLGRHMRFNKEYMIVNQRSGQETWVLGRGNLKFDDNNSPVEMFGTIQDVTERKNAEMEQRRLTDIIEHTRDFIGIATNDGKVLYVNRAGLDLVGLETLDDARAKMIFEYVSEEMRTRLEHEILPGLFSDGFTAGEGTLIDFRTGDDIDVEYNLFMIKTPDSMAPGNIAITMRDITERKRARVQLERSLEEKVVLLKEIHHRVKNNLQIISSLLDLQTYAIEDEAMKGIFRESQNRIKSMALIHETLYRSADFSHIDVGEYIRTLLDHTEDSFGILMADLTLTMETDDITFNLDTAIPCGLMINELVSNALKYAFPIEGEGGDDTRDSAGDRGRPGLMDGERGEIIVELHRTGDDSYRLRVSDNGVGLPADIDPASADTLGLQLVSMLVEQLRGDILINRTNGTEFLITFSTRNMGS